jgi:rSAM/selenodomain-associated transferase 2
MTEQRLPVDQNCPISVIIPALNEATHIQDCITAARRTYTRQEVEILVADGGSRDRTLDLVPKDCTVIQTHPGRALQMNAAARQASGIIFVFCHADSRLPEGWREAVIIALSQPGVSGGTFQTRMEPARGILKWRNRWKMPPNWRLMYGDQCQFMHRSTFDAVGGFPEIPLMEDVEMSRALKDRGQLVRIHLRAITSSRRLLEKGILRQTVGNFWRMVRYLYFNAAPEQIARTYQSSREQAE